MLEFKKWNGNETENDYPDGTEMHHVSLGEGAYGIILVAPDGTVYIEEIPQYGGYPRYVGHVGSVEEALDIIKGWK